MQNIGELVQLDTSSSRSWFFYLGKKLIYCIVCLDDHPTKIFAGDLFYFLKVAGSVIFFFRKVFSIIVAKFLTNLT